MKRLKKRLKRRPPIPERFETPDNLVLLLIETSDPHLIEAWGLEYRQVGSWRLAWWTIFRGEVLHLPQSFYEKPPKDRSPRAFVDRVCAERDFHPRTILYYTFRPYQRETGRLLWGPLTLPDYERLGVDRTDGPVEVVEWDEDGWPVGRPGAPRVPLPASPRKAKRVRLE